MSIEITVILVTILTNYAMRCENKPLLQDDPGFLQEITSIAVEVGLGGARSFVPIREPSWALGDGNFGTKVYVLDGV